MIISEHALKGNGDKLVKEFLSILESATSWLDIREYFESEIGGRKLDASARDSFIVYVTQPVSYSFACHVSCKVKYYWKVANLKSEVLRGRQCSFIFEALSPTSYQLWS